ncbi:MAG TPA: hypothetical protein VL947_08470, partial [Cytophagales bacterium]|nr:hypothetical protein [Cytophagales bacterium]
MKRFFTFLLCTFFVGLVSGQTYTVTNTNANGAGSFEAAFSSATGTPGGSVVDINFDIPGGGPHTINIGGWLNGFGNRTIRINGNTQPGYTVAAPKIILTSG